MKESSFPKDSSSPKPKSVVPPTIDSIYSKYKEEPEDSDGHSSSVESGSESTKSAGLQIANTIMGAGILSIPIVMRYIGILFGTIFIIFIAIVTIYSVHLLIRCEEITGKSGYSMFGKITMGPFGSFLVKIIIIINNFGLCCAYMRIFGETIQTSVSAFANEKSFWVNNWHNYIYIIVCTLIMSIFIFKKSIESLKKIAYLGIISVSLFTISIFVLFCYKGIFKLFDSNVNSKFFFPNCNLMEAFQSMPTVFLAFTFQFNVFPIYFSLKKKNRKNMIEATKIGVEFCLFIFIIVGIIGFTMYGLRMDNTILKELNDDMVKYKNTDSFIKFLIIFINIAFIISTLTCFPVSFFSLKENFLNSIIFCKKYCWVSHLENINNNNKNDNENKNDKNNNVNKNEDKIVEIVDINHNSEHQKHVPLKEGNISRITQKIIIISLYLCISAITILIPKLKIIFHIVGSTAGNFISFIFPNLFFIRLCHMSKKHENLIIPYFLLIIGFCFLIISLVISIIKTD
jgi:amino acid permease